MTASEIEALHLRAVESERRAAMAPYVVEERSGFYTGRELTIPKG